MLLYLHRKVQWNKDRRLKLPQMLLNRPDKWKEKTLYPGNEQLVFAARWREGLHPDTTLVKDHFKKLIEIAQVISEYELKLNTGDRRFTPTLTS